MKMEMLLRLFVEDNTNKHTFVLVRMPVRSHNNALLKHFMIIIIKHNFNGFKSAHYKVVQLFVEYYNFCNESKGLLFKG